MGYLLIQELLFRLLEYKPTPVQWDIHLDLMRIKLIAGGERAGKAIWIETSIPTSSGWKTMGEIKAEDIVFSDRGEPVKVAWVSEVQYNRDCYEITFDSGEKIIADAEHLWAVQTEHDRKNTNRKKINGKETKVEPTPEIIGRKHRILNTHSLADDTLLARPMTKWGSGWVANYSIPVTGAVHYPERILPVEPYVLGAWLGDGTSTCGDITIGDYGIVERIAQLGYDIYKSNDYLRYGIHGLLTQLKGLNVFKNKHIPPVYLESSRDQRIELLKGLMDTDGGGTYKGNEFYNTNEVLIDNIRQLLASLGIKSWKREKIAKIYGKDCGVCYTITFCAPFPVFTLTRKLKKQNLNPTGHTRNHYIRSVIPVQPVPVKCIGIDNDDGLYLITHSYIPTHNSLTSEKELIGHYQHDIVSCGRKKGLYWLLGNDYESCRGEWDYLIEDFIKLEILAEPPTKNIDPGLIRLQDGTKIITKSSKYPEKIAIEAPDGILICEAAQVDYEVFLRANARLAEKRGWLCMAGTFEEEEYVDWYRELYQVGQSYNELELKSFCLPSWTNTIVFSGGRQDPEILRLERSMTPERFMERFGGMPCPKTGRVITEFANNIHVKEIEFNPDLEVEVAVDPGYAGAYAVEAIQDYGTHLEIIDEIYLQGLITKDIITLTKKKPWWGRVTGGAIDIAAKQHQAMEAPIEIWQSEGVYLRTNKISVEDGIDLLRTHLKQHPVTRQPGIVVSPKCRGFIAECGGGKSPVEGGGIWMRNKDTLIPLKKNNHACTAVIFLLANKFGFVEKKLKPFQPLEWAGQYPSPTFTRT